MRGATLQSLDDTLHYGTLHSGTWQSLDAPLALWLPCCLCQFEHLYVEASLETRGAIMYTQESLDDTLHYGTLHSGTWQSLDAPLALWLPCCLC
jgi:hypothetical protein